MKKALRLFMKAYIKPFERVLALRELAVLAGAEPRATPATADRPVCYTVSTSTPIRRLATSLSYWETVGAKEPTPTLQVMRESTADVVRNGVTIESIQRLLPFKSFPALPNRRCLRYGTHGIHEYRGKFFPQLVKALVNIAGVGPGGAVADTMCGSGTALVEASLLGCTGIGMDMNPLSVLMTRTKCALLRCSPRILVSNYMSVRGFLLEPQSRSGGRSLPWLESLDANDQAYLRNWFSAEVLRDLDGIVTRLQQIEEPAVRDLMMLSLSNVLRRVSWQKVDDLRVRREIRPDVEIDPVKDFLEEAGRTVRAVLAFLLQEPKGQKAGDVHVCTGDARRPLDYLSSFAGRTDVVVTSPPYATALPYIDTDRLSLIYLKLLPRSGHRGREIEMIGNREITEERRRRYWSLFETEKASLPGDVSTLIQTVHGLNEDADVGFRRRNLPALLIRYFLDMRSVFTGIQRLLRKGAWAYVVVGNNHTIAGGRRIDIRTDVLLSQIAEQQGFVLKDRIPMEMLISRDIFRKNAVASESILCLLRAQ